MKKNLIINPALIYFSFLLSITGHSQEFVTRLSKESAGNIAELRKQFGTHKSIPEEIELECLTALSFYPQLKNSQQTAIKVESQAADYLKKSKKQRNAGLILSGSGVTIFTAGCILIQHSQSKGENEFPLLAGGLIMTTAGIPFFISAGVNKHKAKVCMKREAIIMTPDNASGVASTSITLRLTL
jgi:hypothetical protein